MKVHVIPWMSPEETERFLKEIREDQKSRFKKAEPEAISVNAEVTAPAARENLAPPLFDVGGF